MLQEGVFTPISNDLTVYIRSRDPRRHAARHPGGRQPRQERPGDHPGGDAAGWSRARNGPRVLLLNGSRQEIDPQTGRLNLLTFKQNEIDLSDRTHSNAARVADMSEVSLSALLNPHPQNPAGCAQMDRRGLQAPQQPAHRACPTR